MGDNIDLNISARIQTKEHCNRSLHWTHQFAVVDRASDPSLETFKKQKSLKDLQYIELLPDPAVQENYIWQWAILVSRVVTKYLPPFKVFRKNVIFHIPHKYSTEMTTKSETVSSLMYNPPSDTGGGGGGYWHKRAMQSFCGGNGYLSVYSGKG